MTASWLLWWTHSDLVQTETKIYLSLRPNGRKARPAMYLYSPVKKSIGMHQIKYCARASEDVNLNLSARSFKFLVIHCPNLAWSLRSVPKFPQAKVKMKLKTTNTFSVSIYCHTSNTNLLALLLTVNTSTFNVSIQTVCETTSCVNRKKGDWSRLLLADKPATAGHR